MVNVKNVHRRGCLTFSFNNSHLWFLIGTPAFGPLMHNNLMQENRPTKFATLSATTELGQMKEGVLVNATGRNENGTWKPLRRTAVWKYLRLRSKEALV